jgi:hypothetical protein
MSEDAGKNPFLFQAWWTGGRSMSHPAEFAELQRDSHLPGGRDRLVAEVMRLRAEIAKRPDPQSAAIVMERIEKLIETIKPFAHFAAWLAAAAEIGEIDPLRDDTIIVQLDAGGGYYALTWAKFRQAAEAFGMSGLEGESKSHSPF